MRLNQTTTDQQLREIPAEALARPRGIGTPAALGLAGLAIFGAITILVQMRVLQGVDHGIAISMEYVNSPALDLWATVADDLAIAEMSVVYGVVLSLILWRAGAGRWSLAPFAFLVPTLIELAFKTWIAQPPIPPSLHFHVPAGNHFPTIVLEGSFPSGHSLRSAFFCTFLAVLLWHRRQRFPRLLALAIVIVAPAIGAAMIYAAWHWTSDVVAGLVLGASFALFVAPPTAERLKRLR